MTKTHHLLLSSFFPTAFSLLQTLALSLTPRPILAAQHEIVVIGEAYQKTRVAVEAFTRSGKPDASPLTTTLTQTMTFDLNNSGFFLTVPHSTDAEILLKADYSLSPGQLHLSSYLYDMAAAKPLFGRRLSGPQTQPRRVVHRMADVIVKQLTGVDGIASTKIVFVADAGGRYKNLFLVDYDGKNLAQLTRDNSLSLAPDWSPNGKEIFYTSYLQGYPRVCQLQLDSGTRTIVSAYPGLNAFPAISPRGNEMVLTLSKDGCVEIYSASLDGSSPRRLTRSRGGVAASPCWSPNGARIAFVSNLAGGPQIYVVNADGTNVRRLFSGFSYVTSVDWSPRGNKIAFSARYRGTLQIFVLDLDTRKVGQVTFDPASHEHPSFAPNGVHIVYVSTDQYHSDLYIVDTRDPQPRRLTSLQGNETYPAWSPVGF